MCCAMVKRKTQFSTHIDPNRINITMTAVKMSNNATNKFRKIRKFYIVLTIIYAPSGVTLTLLKITQSQVIGWIAPIWMGIPFLATNIFCLYNVYVIHREIQKTSLVEEFDSPIMQELKRKNKIMATISIIYIFLITVYVSYVLTGLSYQFWVMYTVCLILHSTEIVGYYFLFILFHSHQVFL
eukprot:TRINITY_DN6225_c0_g1_i3.p1 TRINITY_DN6225_c0_g1~~TRINITY_DN6225_c0_g1_i3.p1  ORF type:complete len:183 (+),score=27.86 TRINITY_DN6225_c0_g1_i3:568-1116(+)